jgi:hypothetical protein
MGILNSILGRVSKGDIVSFLEDDLVIKKSQYTEEKNVENAIAKQLKEEYEDVHQQYNIGGFLGLKCDLDIGDGEYGIELKLAKNLKSASNIERLFGQATYYKQCYGDNFIVLVVGTAKDYDTTMKEIEKLIEQELDVTFLYKEIK